MRVVILSPHFDDAPLSLGQAMLDGVLARHDISVVVLFGRSNWTRWFHPTAVRAPFVSAVRRAEETVTARRFGYRVRVEKFSEAVLRLGTAAPDAYLDPDIDLAVQHDADGSGTAALLDLITACIGRHCATADAVLAPLGVGDHVDHRLVAESARRWAETSAVPVGYYEDRPYAARMTGESVDAVAGRLDRTLHREAGSGPETAEKARRLFYPSQLDASFAEALALDRSVGATEGIWARDDWPLSAGRRGTDADGRGAA